MHIWGIFQIQEQHSSSSILEYGNDGGRILGENQQEHRATFKGKIKLWESLQKE